MVTKEYISFLFNALKYQNIQCFITLLNISYHLFVCDMMKAILHVCPFIGDLNGTVYTTSLSSNRFTSTDVTSYNFSDFPSVHKASLETQPYVATRWINHTQTGIQIHANAYTHTHMHTHAQLHTHACAYTRTHTYTLTHADTHARAYTHAHTHTHTHQTLAAVNYIIPMSSHTSKPSNMLTNTSVPVTPQLSMKITSTASPY